MWRCAVVWTRCRAGSRCAGLRIHGSTLPDALSKGICMYTSQCSPYPRPAQAAVALRSLSGWLRRTQPLHARAGARLASHMDRELILSCLHAIRAAQGAVMGTRGAQAALAPGRVVLLVDAATGLPQLAALLSSPTAMPIR